MTLRRTIAVTLLLSVLFVSGFLAILWWKLHVSGQQILANRGRLPAIQKPIEIKTIVSDTIDPRDIALLHLHRGDLAALQSEWADAEREYLRSVDAGAGVPGLRKLAQAQLQRGKVEPLQHTIEIMKAQGVAAEDLLLIDAIVQLRAGDMAKAEALLVSAAESPQRHYGMALLYILQGNHPMAQAALAKVEEGFEPVLRSYAKTLSSAYAEYALFSKSPSIHLITLIARALAQVQECPLALPLLEQVTSVQVDYRDAWIVRGYCELTTERGDAALSSFEQAYAIDPEKPEIQYFLARAYSALGDHVNATTFLQYALKNGFQPEQEVRRLLAKEGLATGNGSLALEQYQELSEFSDADFETFQNVVVLSMESGHSEDALRAATKAGEKWPDDARAQDLLGWTAMKNHQLDLAETALQRALTLDPTLESAQSHLDELANL